MRDAKSMESEGRDASDVHDAETPDSVLESCRDAWIHRGVANVADDVALEFALDDQDQLFLDVRSQETFYEIDRVDLAGGARAPFMSEPAGSIRMLDALGGRFLVLRSMPQDRIDPHRIEYVRGGVSQPFLYPGTATVVAAPRAWLGHGFVIVGLLGNDRVVGKPDDAPSFPRHGVTRASVSGRYYAGRQFLFDETRIVVYSPSLADPLFSRLIVSPPPDDVEIGPWLLDDTVFWIEDDRILRFTLGDVEPSRLIEETGCLVLDAKANTVVVGCGRLALAPVPSFAELRVLIGGALYDVADPGGAISEAAVLSEGRIAWRAWRDPNDLCSGTLEEAALIRVQDVRSQEAPEVIGRSLAPCFCCGREWPALRFEAEGNSVAWNYDLGDGRPSRDPPAIAASYDSCAAGDR